MWGRYAKNETHLSKQTKRTAHLTRCYHHLTCTPSTPSTSKIYRARKISRCSTRLKISASLSFSVISSNRFRSSSSKNISSSYSSTSDFWRYNLHNTQAINSKISKYVPFACKHFLKNFYGTTEIGLISKIILPTFADKCDCIKIIPLRNGQLTGDNGKEQYAIEVRCWGMSFKMNAMSLHYQMLLQIHSCVNFT